MMFDFRDVAAATKAEQIRAWAVEQAIDVGRETMAQGLRFNDDDLVKTSSRIEKFILEGEE